jgi:L-fucose mutarotase
MEMGHGDEIVIADGNFPAASCAKRLIRCDGHNVSELLDAILKFFPVDTDSKYSASLMQVDIGEKLLPVIWEEYKKVLRKYESNFQEFNIAARQDFYDKAKNAYAVIATSESALYANIILRKGIV